MKNKKFNEKDKAYMLYNVHELIHHLGTSIVHAFAVKEIYITKVGRENVNGFLFENYGALCRSAGKEEYVNKYFKIISKPRKNRGKIMPFIAIDTVTVEITTKMDQLYTMDEIKLKLIKYISNDFKEDSDLHCWNCNCDEE